jgi:hypothetical protein
VGVEDDGLGMGDAPGDGSAPVPSIEASVTSNKLIM